MFSPAGNGASHTRYEVTALGGFILLGLLVLGPLLGSGYLLLLDAPAGPHPSWPSLFPLPSEGLVSADAPFGLLARALGLLSTELPNKALIVGCIALAGYGMFRFGRRTLEAQWPAAAAGGCLYAINPFVYDRLLAGQLYLAVGYGLIPWALPALARVARKDRSRDVLTMIVWLVGISLVDIHVGGLMLVLSIGALASSTRPWSQKLGYALATLVALLGAHMFWLLPSLLAGEAGRLGTGDLSAYAPRPRSTEILPRALLLHGFWRREFTTPIDRNPVIFLTAFIPLLAAAATGFVSAMRSEWRRAAVALGTCGLLGLVLGMGTSFSPAAGLTRFLYDYMPGYGIFREPHKWIALVALFYSVFLMVALDGATRLVPRKTGRWLVALTGLALPLVATWIMLWGFSGRVELSTFPSDWQRAAQETSEDGRVLFFPWNLYQPLPFAGNRIIASPARHFFGSSTLISDDPALSVADPTEGSDPRRTYVHRLLDHRGRVKSFGNLVAPLGVRYVVLANIADAPEYSFLREQEDLRLVFEGPDLDLYENEAWRGSEYPLVEGDPSSTLSDLLKDEVGQRAAATSIHAWGAAEEANVIPGATLLKREIFWNVPSSESGILGTDRSCMDGWLLDDRGSTCHLGAVAAFETRDRPEFLWRPEVWNQVLGWFATFLTLVGLASWGWRSRSHIHGESLPNDPSA